MKCRLLGLAEIDQDLDLSATDMARFQASVAVQRICNLILSGGSQFGRPDLDNAYSPDPLILFVERALAYAKRTGYFDLAWSELKDYMPLAKFAWEQGKILFLYDLDRAESNPEDLGYLEQIDFAVDCYAYVNAAKSYPDSKILQAWFINGYMVGWRGHFLREEGGLKDAK